MPAPRFPLYRLSSPNTRRARVLSSPVALSLEQLRQIGMVAALRASPLFAGLPASDLDAVAAITHLKSLAKGEYLFHQGETAHAFYVVQKGAINMHRVNALGKEQIIHIFRAGESVAQETIASLVENSGAVSAGYLADARAVEASQVLRVQKAGFVELLRRQSELGLRMLHSMSSYLSVLVRQIEDLTLKDVEARLVSWLITRCPDPHLSAPVEIRLNMTKRVLAAELGAASETLSRTLARFRAARMVEVKGKSIVVLSPARLRRGLAQESKLSTSKPVLS